MPANKAETPSVADDNVKWGVLGQLGSSGQGVQPPPRPPREVDQMRMDGHETAGTIGPASKQSAPDNLRSSHGAAAAAVTTALQQKQLYASAQLSVPSHLRSPHGAVAVSTAESHLDKWLQTVKECRKNDKTADKRPLFHENSTTSISRSQNTVHTNEKSTPEGQDILQLSHSSREITDSFLTEQVSTSILRRFDLIKNQCSHCTHCYKIRLSYE